MFCTRAVLANVPSFGFLGVQDYQKIILSCQGSTAGKDLWGEISAQGNICQNHPFRNHPFANPELRARTRHSRTSFWVWISSGGGQKGLYVPRNPGKPNFLAAYPGKVPGNLSTSDFQSEVGKVFGEIGGELPAKFGRRFSSFFCWGESSEAFSTKTPPQVSPSNFTMRFWVVAGPRYPEGARKVREQHVCVQFSVP